MATESLDAIMKAPEKWGTAEWTYRFNTLFTFLCADEIEEIEEISSMAINELTMEIEQLLIALVVHGLRKNEFSQHTILERRKLLLSSIKGMERYSEVVQVANIMQEILPKDHH